MCYRGGLLGAETRGGGATVKEMEVERAEPYVMGAATRRRGGGGGVWGE